MRRTRILADVVRWSGAILVLLLGISTVEAEQKGRHGFHLVTIDEKGIETELQNAVFYYEEKISDTSFIPHKLNGIPVKRGAAIVHVKFETIREIEFKSNLNHEAPTSIITLTNGKTGEFTVTIMGSFKGASDFGEVRVPASGIKRVLFK